MNITDLSDGELLSGIHGLIGQGRALLARLLVYLAEVEERRLDLQSACSSLFDFCVRRLGMSEDEACRRVMAARLARRFPFALPLIENGDIHLTAFLMLREHLTEENHAELLRAASGKTKAQVQELLAARFPRPDAPSMIRGRCEPLSPERYQVQFTASAELKAKIDRAADLMRHANPSGELSVILERAIDLLLAELEKQRLGKTKRPVAKAPRSNTRRGYVTRSIRREVFQRDGEQCTFVDDAGRRCECRTFLELDHIEPRARGGSDGATNLRVRCKSHNAYAAERDFGRDYIEKKKAEQKSRPRQRGYEFDAALNALTSMGFNHRRARDALQKLEARWSGTAITLETVLRETLSVLT
ncbi:hypothetical protein LZC95_33310 [Pendulispora brunnea]|uniref:HNH nuclease domain-containing protein n=1 Tax=Pendulispora brunnea TaxID=2905690 RepID=A0ABZ2JXV3_9BACT